MSLWESAYGLTNGGDSNGDADSDGLDFLSWQIQRSLQRQATDFNGDRRIDRADLSVWEASFGVDSGADADGDGYSNGLDFLRWQMEAPAAAAPPAADFNGDRKVDAADLDVWESAFGVDDRADADRDGDSDGFDFLVWQAQNGLGALSEFSGAATVPEPSSGWLSVCVCLLAGSRRR